MVIRDGKLHWNAQHEGHDLQDQVEAYKKRYGYYPEVVIADTVYGSRDNRSFLKQRNIRFTGKPLGRPPKITLENEDEVKRQKEQRHRNTGNEFRLNASLDKENMSIVSTIFEPNALIPLWHGLTAFSWS